MTWKEFSTRNHDTYNHQLRTDLTLTGQCVQIFPTGKGLLWRIIRKIQGLPSEKYRIDPEKLIVTFTER